MKTKTAFGMALLLFGVVAATQAQNVEIKASWLHLTNNPNGVPGFPILKTLQGTRGESNTTSDMDLITSLRRYDANRLLLFVVENGINETDAAHDAALAAEYPDRTLWWINANTGAPIGKAITFPLKPWPDTDVYLSIIRGENPDLGGPRPDLEQEEMPKVEVDAEGNLYLTDKHHLLRYTPNANGGFDGPTLAWNYQPENEPKVVTPDGREGNILHWRGFNMLDIQIKGKGANKIMTTTRRHWADNGGVWYFTTSDGGATWTANHYMGKAASGLEGIGGGSSLPIINADGTEEWIFCASFPGSGDTVYRFIRPAGTNEEFQLDVADFWTPGVDPNDAVGETEKYNGWTKVDVAAMDGIPYAVVATLPLWQSDSRTDLDPVPTAWLALLNAEEDLNGDGIMGDYSGGLQIPFTEMDEQGSPDYESDNWNASYSTEVTMYRGDNYPAGAFEILWSGGTMGYGRFTVGGVPVTDISEWALF